MFFKLKFQVDFQECKIIVEEFTSCFKRRLNLFNCFFFNFSPNYANGLLAGVSGCWSATRLKDGICAPLS